MRTLRQLERLLKEAAERRTWGSITIDLKEGQPFLIKQTIQTKPDEDYPDGRIAR